MEDDMALLNGDRSAKVSLDGQDVWANAALDQTAVFIPEPAEASNSVLEDGEDFFGAGVKDAPPDGDPVEATNTLLDAFRTSVNVKIKAPKQYDIELDIDNLTFEHMQLMEKVQGGNLSADELQEALREIIFIISGRDVSTLPLRVTNSILTELKNAMQGATSPNA